MSARLLAPLAVLLTAGCVVGTGERAVEERTVGAFSRIWLSAFVDVDVVAGPPEGATLACDSNLLEHVITPIVRNEIEIGADAGRVYQPKVDCRYATRTETLAEATSTGTGDLLVVGPFSSFRYATVRGSGHVQVEDVTGEAVRASALGAGSLRIRRLVADEVVVQSTGSGHLEVSGAAETATVDASGSGDVVLAGLGLREVRVDASGSGDVDVLATEHAVIRMTGSGDVTVRGGAVVDYIGTGTGQLVIIDGSSEAWRVGGTATSPP